MNIEYLLNEQVNILSQPYQRPGQTAQPNSIPAHSEGQPNSSAVLGACSIKNYTKGASCQQRSLQLFPQTFPWTLNSFGCNGTWSTSRRPGKTHPGQWNVAGILQEKDSSLSQTKKTFCRSFVPPWQWKTFLQNISIGEFGPYVKQEVVTFWKTLDPKWSVSYHKDAAGISFCVRHTFWTMEMFWWKIVHLACYEVTK